MSASKQSNASAGDSRKRPTTSLRARVTTASPATMRVFDSGRLQRGQQIGKRHRGAGLHPAVVRRNTDQRSFMTSPRAHRAQRSPGCTWAREEGRGKKPPHAAHDRHSGRLTRRRQQLVWRPASIHEFQAARGESDRASAHAAALLLALDLEPRSHHGVQRPVDPYPFRRTTLPSGPGDDAGSRTRWLRRRLGDEPCRK